jgi:hypothetical protein
MIGIETKFIPATNTKGARVKAFVFNGQQVTRPYNYEKSELEAHFEVVQAFIAEKFGDMPISDNSKTLTYGSTQAGYFFCFPQSTITAA